MARKRRSVSYKPARRLLEEAVPLATAQCAYCGCGALDRKMTADHVVPRVKGGRNALDNLVWACERCNRWKGSLSLDDLHLPKERQAASEIKGKSESEAVRVLAAPPFRYGPALIREAIKRYLTAG